MDTPDQPITSYATPARRRGYVRAMHQIAAGRTPGTPVRVYLSAPPEFLTRPSWQHRIDTIRAALPTNSELLTYQDAFDPAADYHAQWAALAETLDGLVVTGTRRDKRRPREQTLGPIARQELITMVSAGRPVLLHRTEYGLVPVLDCRPKRIGQDPHQRLRLTIPRDWSPSEPTLQAALHALGAEPADNTGETEPSKPSHLTHPFAPPPPAP
ncbi:hypothetical protein AB0B79_05715 [Streptomyces sp. NPDC039022]|uniref:hypothetical protein n=1 Tax=unclassified Streptomyces TaxID=2593676 RepID=UPI0033D526EF